MSFIKRLLAEITGELEASMTKRPSAQSGLGLRISRHIVREYIAGQAQRKGYMAAQKASGRSKEKPAASAPGGRRAGERQGGTSTSTQSTSTPATRTRPARPARPARTRPARPARPARTRPARPARPARTRKKPSENDDDK